MAESVAHGGLTMFLCGDVMTGRGVDQILWHPNTPELHEPYVNDAREYVDIAQRVNGTIPYPVDPRYVWGDALDELARIAPDVRIINLETSVTSSDEYWEGKGINYRMHPENVACLPAAGIDVCVLANNHVLDYGDRGLDDTIRTLRSTGMATAGAGRSLAEAQQPAIVPVSGERRVLVFSFGTDTSGIPSAWAATATRPGVNLLRDLSAATADAILEGVRAVKRRGDIAIASIHWGPNWGYAVPDAHVAFAHRLLDGDIDLLHGHSSHHPRPIEIHNGKLALYGCGDFLNDYEGISGNEEFRGDLVLMYFATLDPQTGQLTSLRLTPMQVRNMRLTHASRTDAEWLRETITRASRDFGVCVQVTDPFVLGGCALSVLSCPDSPRDRSR